MKLINKTDANLNIALIAKNMAKSDAQKALMGRVLFMMDNMPTIEAIPKADYEARLTELRSMALRVKHNTGSINTLIDKLDDLLSKVKE